MEQENNIPDKSKDFVAPTDPQDNETEIKHPDEDTPSISPEERRRRIDEFTKKCKEAEDEKVKRWYEIRVQVETIADGVGKGIDENIKEGVTAFMAMEFSTNQSCDGHGLAGPWVEVYTPAPDGWKESEEKQQQWRESNHIEKVKMEQLLQEFYKDREVPKDVQLVLDPQGIFEAFRVQSAGHVDLWETLKQEKQYPERARTFKDEMDVFTNFLKEKYFQR